MFNNETRNQHFISQVEQKLNCINPSLPRDRRRIYKFKIDDREELTFNLVNPLGVKIENNLSFNDLYTFDVFPIELEIISKLILESMKLTLKFYK